MIHIFCDSASMIEPEYAAEHQISVFPLLIEIDGGCKKDQIEINADQVLDAIRKEKVLHTSQPCMGDKLEAYNQALEDPRVVILDLCMADGLSGTWQSACLAAAQCEDPSRVRVINTKTLAGPLKAIVEKAVSMKEQGSSAEEIEAEIERMTGREHSLLAIEDLGAIGRSGRIPKAAAAAGNMLHLVPVVEKSEDGTKLGMHKVFRTMKKACKSMVNSLIDDGKETPRTFYICHAQNEAAALEAKKILENLLPQAKSEILPLCSLFCVHGGPGCIAIQAV